MEDSAQADEPSESVKPGREIRTCPYATITIIGCGDTDPIISEPGFLRTVRSVITTQKKDNNMARCMFRAGRTSANCIRRKWRKGMDYSWHVQHLLREFGRGQFADPR